MKTTTLEVMERRMRFRNYSGQTIKTYTSYASKFLNSFESDAYHIPTKEAKKYLENYKYSSVSQQNQIISAIKFLYREVLNSKLRDLKIARPRKEKKLPRVLDKDYLIGCIQKISNLKHKAIIQIAFSTGMRVSEVINLKIVDIDSSRMLINIRGAKGNKDRIVRLTDSTLNLLREYYRKFKPKTFMFNGQFSPKYSSTSCNNIVKKYIGKEYHFHELRHSSLTSMIDCGTDVSIVQKIAGHNSVKTTMGYLHVSKRMIQNVHAPI